MFGIRRLRGTFACQGRPESLQPRTMTNRGVWGWVFSGQPLCTQWADFSVPAVSYASLISRSLTRFSSILGSSEVRKDLECPCLEIRTTVGTNHSYQGPRSCPPAPTPGVRTHWTMRSRPGSRGPRGAFVMQERSRNFILLRRSFVFKETILCECVLEHRKLLNQPKRRSGGGGGCRATLQNNHFLSN